MILQALTQYYETLAARGAISRSGWAKVKISYALEIDRNGALLDVLPLFVQAEQKGKTVSVPRELDMPAPVKRSSGIAANFLWDNAIYILGISKSNDPKDTERALKCFCFMGNYHKQLFENCSSDMAQAILRFFEAWDCTSAASHPKLVPILKELLGGANLTFFFENRFPNEEPEFAEIWQKEYDSEEGVHSVCLVTGKNSVPQEVHPPIKGVYGAQSSGAAIVSFNAPAFTSFGKEQSLNAPVGKYAAFAYTTALNYLISDPKHRKLFGNMTVVYWAEDAEPAEDDFLASIMDTESAVMKQEDLDSAMRSLAEGAPVDIDGITVQPENHFYILALSPNAARISVRFFYSDTFGHLAGNMKAHYDRMEIVGAKPMLPLWQLISATVRNVDGKAVGDASPHLSGDLFRAILSGTRYPDTLFQQILLRVRAERNLTPTRAALIKAYLLKNETDYKEVLTVKLNEETTYQPYVLGELFALLEEIQENASNATTIKDRYFTSACTTPAIVFPRVIDLAEKHLKKLDTPAKIRYSKEMNRLLGKLTESYPARHSLQEQGVFQIGYYHRKEKRYEKKNSATDTDNKED